ADDHVIVGAGEAVGAVGGITPVSGVCPVAGAADPVDRTGDKAIFEFFDTQPDAPRPAMQLPVNGARPPLPHKMGKGQELLLTTKDPDRSRRGPTRGGGV